MPADPVSQTWHVLVIDDEQGRRALALSAATYSIGRDPSNAIVIHSAAVSRQHALLLRLPQKDGQYTYRLLDGNIEGKRSTNGLSVNGQRCLSWDLKDGDQILLGEQVRLQYYVCRSSEVDLQQYLQEVSFRSLKTPVLDRRATTLQRFEPSPVQVAPPAQAAAKVAEGEPSWRNPIRLLVQAIWRRLWAERQPFH
jgi:pSer/pThr/pTyr-binding forkhead associated (FHA) protein